MSKKTAKPKQRQPLTREVAIARALKLADQQGLEGLTMRALAQALGVEAMSLYHHVQNKDDILDAMVDEVFAEVKLPAGTWRESMRGRAESMREVLKRHRWALPLMESRRTPGPKNLTHHDAVLGMLRRAGFSLPLTAHAYALLDAFVYGFVHTELQLPFETTTQTQDMAQSMAKAFPPGAWPNLVEFMSMHVMTPGYSYGNSFEYGLDLLLDGLELARAREK